MKEGDKAEELIRMFSPFCSGSSETILNHRLAIRCALHCVIEILNSNPHGNPLNSSGESTMEYWLEVQKILIGTA